MTHLVCMLGSCARTTIQQSLLGIALFASAHPIAAGQSQQRDLIAMGGETSVEAFVEHLPAAMRNNYVLVFQSRSLQGASRGNPRAILFAPKADLIVTFNGESSQRGYSDVEVMRFDPESKAFLFQEIHFSSDRTSGNSNAPTLSEVNPSRCTVCHGDPPRPIWDSSPLWPGVYGEHYRARLTGYEKAGLDEFLAQQPSHPRYRWLLSADRLAEAGTFRPSAQQTYKAQEQVPPNLRLSLLLAGLNFQNIAARISSHPDFASAMYPLLASLSTNCDNLAPYLPEERNSSLFAELQSFRARSRRENARQREAAMLRTARGSVSIFEGTEDLADFRFVTERLLGFDTGAWTMALEKNTFDFSSPLSSAFLFGLLLQAATTADRNLGDLAALNASQEDKKFCSYLRRRTAATAPAQKPFSVASTATARHTDLAGSEAAPRLLAHCALCHTQGPGPKIPFQDSAALAKQLLQVSGNGATLLDEIAFRLSPEAGVRRMPMNLLPSHEDVRDLLDYFRRLSAMGVTDRYSSN